MTDTLRPGQIGAVPAIPSFEMPDETVETQIRLAGADAVYGDRHRVYEEDFNALVEHEVKAGRVAPEVGEMAVANFHVYMQHSRFPQPNEQHSPRFYQ